MMGMRTFLRILVAAVLGGSASGVAQQYLAQRQSGAPDELVVATTTSPILAGTIAGLLAPRQYKMLAAFGVAAIVGLAPNDPVDVLLTEG